MKICSRPTSHMTKMVAIPIYGKKRSKIFSLGTVGPVSTKLGMYHWGFPSIIVCSNNDPGVTLTYLTERSNFVI